MLGSSEESTCAAQSQSGKVLKALKSSAGVWNAKKFCVEGSARSSGGNGGGGTHNEGDVHWTGACSSFCACGSVPSSSTAYGFVFQSPKVARQCQNVSKMTLVN